MGIVNSLRFIMLHPLNTHQKLKAIRRFVFWQVGSRVVPGPVVVNFVNDTRLLVKPGMTGATGNIYTGLHEFEDMAFLLHCLKQSDLFIDIGANVGSYTILAGAAVGANCLSFEPIPSSFAHLMDNICLNRINDHVAAYNIGIGSHQGVLKFTTGLDTVNHVVLADKEMENGGLIEVRVKSLDEMAGSLEPTLIKIDVEGYETEVIAGADKVLCKSSLLAIIMELNGSGNRYGYDEVALHKKLLDYGFRAFTYSPFDRSLIAFDKTNVVSSRNILYIKDVHAIEERLHTAPKFAVRGQYI